MRRMMRRANNKRAMFSMEVFTKITFVIIILFLFFFVGGKLWAAVFGGGGDKDTRANFDSLVQNIQFMLSKLSNFEYQSMIFYMKDDYYVFALNGPETIGAYSMNVAKSQDYPKQCNNKPCLCFYKGSDNLFSKPVSCKAFDSNVVFHGYFGKQNTEWESESLKPIVGKVLVPKQELALYSDYPENLRLDFYNLGLGHSSEFTQSLYIEKLVINGKIHIFISPYVDDAHISYRVSLLATCPDNSDVSCIGKIRNALIEGTKDYCSYNENTANCTLKKAIEECKLNEKIDKTCTCGRALVDMDALRGETRYCFKRSTNNPDNILTVLSFNCGSVASCSDYCKIITNTDDCDNNEIAQCNINRCGILSGSNTECEFYSVYDKYYCRPRAGTSQN
jgi:hypothetical protein